MHIFSVRYTWSAYFIQHFFSVGRLSRLQIRPILASILGIGTARTFLWWYNIFECDAIKKDCFIRFYNATKPTIRSFLLACVIFCSRWAGVNRVGTFVRLHSFARSPHQPNAVPSFGSAPRHHRFPHPSDACQHSAALLVAFFNVLSAYWANDNPVDFQASIVHPYGIFQHNSSVMWWAVDYPPSLLAPLH